MKVMWINDIHLRGKSSVHRLGNYFQDVLNKLDEVIEIYIEKKCNYLIIAGDLFDSHTVSNNVVDEFVDKIEKNGIKVKVIFGNHDLVNCNFEASKSSSLYHVLRRSDCFQHLKYDVEDNCELLGVDYKFDIENEIREKGIVFDESDNLKIAVTHAFITEKDFHPNVNFIKAKDIITNADLIICSHFHEEFDITINNTRFVNLGAFGRLSIGEAKHHPKVAVIDCESQEIDIINLMSAKPGHEVFDLSKYNETKENKKNIKDFLEKLNSIEWQSMDFKTQISKIGKEEKIDKEVIDYIFEKMENKNE